MKKLGRGWILKNGRLMRDTPAKNRRTTALHEAAHAVVAHVMGGRVRRLWLKSEGVGYTEVEFAVVRRIDPIAFAVHVLAGHEAEHLAYGRPINELPAEDYGALVKQGYGEKSINIMGYLTRKLLPALMRDIHKVQRALLSTGSLTRRQFLAALREA